MGKRKGKWSKVDVTVEKAVVQKTADSVSQAQHKTDDLFTFDTTGGVSAKARKTLTKLQIRNAQEKYDAKRASGEIFSERKHLRVKPKRHVKDVEEFNSMDIWGDAERTEVVEERKIVAKMGGWGKHRNRTISQKRVLRRPEDVQKATKMVIPASELPLQLGASVNPSEEAHQAQLQLAKDVDAQLRAQEEDLKLRLSAKHPDQIPGQEDLPQGDDTSVRRPHQSIPKTKAQKNKQKLHKQKLVRQNKAKHKKMMEHRAQQDAARRKQRQKHENRLATDEEYRKAFEAKAAEKLYVPNGIQKPYLKMPDVVLTEEVKEMDGKMRKALVSNTIIKEQFDRFQDRNMTVRTKNKADVDKKRKKREPKPNYVTVNGWKQMNARLKWVEKEYPGKQE